MRGVNEKLVTVMVPVYNEENYIEDCLNSIYNQTYLAIELIISDDCSTDQTLKIMRKWINEHKDRFVRCEIIENSKNLGIAKNFNVPIRASKGYYLKSLAGDDMLMPDAIEKEVDYLEEHSDVCMVYANAWRITSEDHYPFESTAQHKLFFETYPIFSEGLAQALFKADVIPAPTVMLTRNTINKYGIYREDLAFEDWEYWLRLATGGGIIGYLDYPVVGWRELEISGSHYSAGSEEEKRYNRVIDSEVRLLKDYQDKVKDGSMDSYWNRTIKLCIDKNYRSTVNKIMSEQSFIIEPITKLMLMAYRLHIYKPVSKIYMHVKHGQ